ncbi:hypothetical protein [uncultured Methanobrevibacter sp.]|uniref:hypothetical protein n=1 Tax=uncultured Methanobrevibacter sp. TaxID=253161 RepID=UPI0025D31F50|nr:hypothetical protein [uncultured Methanobrevibacter sp.]
MVALTIEVLKKIIENIPEDYEIMCDSGKDVFKLSDKIMVDITEKTLIFKRY